MRRKGCATRSAWRGGLKALAECAFEFDTVGDKDAVDIAFSWAMFNGNEIPLRFEFEGDAGGLFMMVMR